ncbi:hypothetical protein PMAYCL1PPCAC_01401, partial [Pristionchus mayeri]
PSTMFLYLLLLASLLGSTYGQSCKPQNELGPCMGGAAPCLDIGATCLADLQTCCAQGAVCGGKNDPPTQADLWDLRYYYNRAKVLHAFSATPEGYEQIQNNGIRGYTSKADEGSLGATLSDDGFAKLAEVCSDQAERDNIKKLWFVKSGQAYRHSFEDPKSTDAVYVGYVSLKQNACGAIWPKKRWACAVSADMMYAGDLSKNTWYAGRQQDGGKVHFWLWEFEEAKRNKQRNGTIC